MLVISAREVYHLYSETDVLIQRKKLAKGNAQKNPSDLKTAVTAHQYI